MGIRCQGGLVVALVCLFATPVFADAKGDVAAKSKEAMESYDLMDYDAAKKTLATAIAAAKKAKLEKDPVYARAHLYLGLAAFAAGDAAGAKAAFSVAVAIDPKIQIEAAYKSPELVKLLDTARLEVSSGGTAAPPDASCAAVKGLAHEIIDTARAGTAQPIEVQLGSDLAPAKVAVMYRPEGATEFVEGKLVKSGCKFTGQIPASALRGAVVHYYVAAYDGNNKVLAGKGSAGSPNIIEIAGGVAGGGGGSDTEDPLTKKKGGESGSISGGVIAGGQPPKVYVAVFGGTGFGYVSGNTEAGNEVQNCCIGNSLLVVTPELGYYASPRLAIGLAARIGFPIGANVDPPEAKHSTIAPAAVVRVRYALAASGEGLRFMGQLGGGVMRNTIKLEMEAGGGDTDIVAQGPLLIGAGIGYQKSLSSSVSFVADLSALAGIAVVDKIGTAKLNTGVGGDLSLGFLFGF